MLNLNQDFDVSINSFFRDKTVLITGGLGLTGSNLARRLVSLGAKVSIYTKSLRHEANIKDIKERVEIILGDISDKNKIQQAVLNKDFIFLLAGQTSVPISMENPFLDLELNARATLNVLEACKEFNKEANIIFAGTIREAGQIENTYAREKQREDPTSIFDLHKLTSEKYLQIYNKVYGLKTVTLRFSNIFGMGQVETDPHVSVINHFVKKAIIDKELQVYGNGGPLRDYNYVENIVDACLIASTTPKAWGNVYITGSGEGRNFKQFLDSLKEILKKEYNIDIEITKVPTPEIISKTVQGDVIADYYKFMGDTGWKPKISFQEGLKKTVEFYMKG